MEQLCSFLPYIPYVWSRFIEGTNLTDETLAISHKFARKNGLPIMNHVLAPRVKGFARLIFTEYDSRLLDFSLPLMHFEGKSIVFTMSPLPMKDSCLFRRKFCLGTCPSRPTCTSHAFQFRRFPAMKRSAIILLASSLSRCY